MFNIISQQKDANKKHCEILHTTMAKIKMTVKFQIWGKCGTFGTHICCQGLCKMAQLFGKPVGQFF